MSKHLHIISHDVPWPADYGGVVDIFQTIVWLKKNNISIHLHCFFKERLPAPELNKYCVSVQYYKRKKSGIISSNIPYIVKSRSSKALIAQLKKDNYPVLMQGMHSTWPLYKNLSGNRKIFIRTFNTEQVYYDFLATHEKNKLKKLYFKRESNLLKQYERDMASKAPLITLSKKDRIYFAALGGDARFIPALLPWQEVTSKTGAGGYCLYHGNLSVTENAKAAEWLIGDVFTYTSFPLVIAGKNPSERLKQIIQFNPSVKLVENPADETMQELIENAHIHVLPSFNNTGVKLKLLNALYNGRHCIVNAAAVEGSGLDPVSHICNSATEFRDKINELKDMSFDDTEIQQRRIFLQELYNNEKNAAELISLIY